MKILEMNHIHKSFGDLEVIKDISLSVAEGEILSIIGPSGSGKSTILRCATMLETINGGEIIYMGEKAAYTDENGNVIYAKGDKAKKINSNFGLVFQNFNLFPHYSVYMFKSVIKQRFLIRQESFWKKWVFWIRRIITLASFQADSSKGCLLQERCA